MARATRSSANIEKSDDSTRATTKTALTKKRKRASVSPHDDQQPSAKHSRTESEDEEDVEMSTGVGDLPLGRERAVVILDVLEMHDSQGLLDRVFSLDSDQPATHSFRSLLKDSQNSSLSTLKSAIQHLSPLHASSRTPASSSAAKQLQFCSLALSLLNEASTQSIELPPDIESIFSREPQKLDDDDDDRTYQVSSPRYALVQHLPQGDYWTSLNDTSHPGIADLKHARTGHAELVAIAPFPSSSSSTMQDVPKLGSLSTPLPPVSDKMPQQRRLTSGSFLDYGSWSSFAPTFEQDGVEIGKRQLGEVFHRRELKRKQKELRRRFWIGERENLEDVQEIAMDSTEAPAEVMAPESVKSTLEGLLPEAEVQALISSLSHLQVEDEIHKLLEKNRRALLRLQELQDLRFSTEGGNGAVKEDSEEMETAQGIWDSLALLASLRPRASDDEYSPLLPSPDVLHKLHLTLPMAATRGWQGTLPPSRSTALRDDTTIKVRAGVTVPAPSTSVATSVAAAPFNGYSYQYRAPTAVSGYAATAYKTTGASSYYQAASYPATPATGGNYYGAQGTSQQPYGVSWYNSATPGTSTSGRGTPQPTIPVASYGGFFNVGASATPSRAVANTVVGKGGQWNAVAYVPPQAGQTYLGAYQAQTPR